MAHIPAKVCVPLLKTVQIMHLNIEQSSDYEHWLAVCTNFAHMLIIENTIAFFATVMTISKMETVGVVSILE